MWKTVWEYWSWPTGEVNCRVEFSPSTYRTQWVVYFKYVGTVQLMYCIGTKATKPTHVLINYTQYCEL